MRLAWPDCKCKWLVEESNLGYVGKLEEAHVMSIINIFKRLISGASSGSVEQAQSSRKRLGYDRPSANDEQIGLMCIQGCFRVINESIEIARKSKNLETKLSRLGVARNTLKTAQEQASLFSLKVDGLDAAEAEINRISEAIKTGTPTEIPGMQQIDANAAYSSAARNLLMEATALKREKKYIEACDKLREAYSADGAGNLFIEERLRLPMYLQLAGGSDEGWDELNRLYAGYTDQFSQSRIEHQMKVFLRKENNETASNPVRVILRGDGKPSKTVSEPRSVTVGELQSEPMSAWGNDDIIKGLKFSATLQLRNPLRVLLRHGEIHTDRNMRPPEIAREGWEGIWFSVTGIDWGPSTVASDIGPILADDYLPFLIAVRKIVESHNSIERRIEQLREMPLTGDWKIYIARHGPSHISRSRGADWIIAYFFPRFVDNIPKINAATIDELSRLGLDTPNRIAVASDEKLLNIKGIGQAKLNTIRNYCAGITDNRDADRVENVIR